MFVNEKISFMVIQNTNNSAIWKRKCQNDSLDLSKQWTISKYLWKWYNDLKIEKGTIVKDALLLVKVSLEMQGIAILFSFNFLKVFSQILNINFIHWSFLPYCLFYNQIHMSRSARIKFLVERWGWGLE